MKCGDVRHLIHLNAGHDLSAAEEHELASHLEGCSECRAYHEGMAQAMSALHHLRDFGNAVAVSAERRSTASLMSRLPDRSPRSHTFRKFNGRVAALAVCSLALAVVTIVQTLPSSYSSGAYSSNGINNASGYQVSQQPGGMRSGIGRGPGADSVPVFGSDGRVVGYLRLSPAGGVQTAPVMERVDEQTY